MQQLNFLPSEPRRPLELRPYQQQMKRDIYAHIKAGTNRILVYGPTGSGKTLVLSSVLQDALSRGRRCLLLVHRDFLVEQTMATLLNLGVESDHIGIIKAGYQEDRARPLQIAGLQSLNNRPIPEDIGLVVADECHSVAFWGGYQRVKDAAPDAIQLGFTASPWRLKPHIEYFGQHYDAIVRGPSIKSLIHNGWLSPARYFGFGGIDITKLEAGKDGDFKQGLMESVFIAADIPKLVVEKLKEFADDRTGIIFNSGVEQSLLQTQLLNDAGISCAHVDADTPGKERLEIYRKLDTGALRCISSIGCLTEGFDVRSISFIVLARATKSRSLYVQMCGRGLRFHPDKEDCLMFDFGGNITRRGLGFLSTDWNIALEQAKVKEQEPAIKICPNCSTACHNFVKICPNCGHEFGDVEVILDTKEFEKEFGELFEPGRYKMVKWIRTRRKELFLKNLNPDILWEEFKKKYGQEAFLLSGWLKNAIFGGKCTLANQQRFLDYLDRWKPFGTPLVEFVQFVVAEENWLEHHIKIELGKVKVSSFPRASCWKTLGVTKQSTRAEIKAAYQAAIKLVNDNGEQIDLLNWAFDKVMLESTRNNHIRYLNDQT